MNINAYCFEWHLSKSPAFKKILVEPLSSILDIDLIDINQYKRKTSVDPVIFCQISLDPEEFKKHKNVTWLPMWDACIHLPDSWWENIPKHVKVLAYSDKVYKKAMNAKLKTLRVKYFKNPAESLTVNWDNNERSLYYWNRVELFSTEFILTFCKSLCIKTIYLGTHNDPNLNSYSSLDTEVLTENKIDVKNSSYLPKNEYKDMLQKTNIYLAPRLYEGVGLSFLEAMARGCAVFAVNEPTMNEYVQHKENGYLFNSKRVNEQYAFRIKNKIKTVFSKNNKTYNQYPITHKLDKNEISILDIKLLGENAYKTSVDGYYNWTSQKEIIADFIIKE